MGGLHATPHVQQPIVCHGKWEEQAKNECDGRDRPIHAQWGSYQGCLMAMGGYGPCDPRATLLYGGMYALDRCLVER